MSTCTSIRRRADLSIIPKLLAVSLSLTLAGCASLETAADHAHDLAARHPVATAVGAAVAASAITVALDRRRDDHRWSVREGRGIPCAPAGSDECRP
jgi:hypothetical protein